MKTTIKSDTDIITIDNDDFNNLEWITLTVNETEADVYIDELTSALEGFVKARDLERKRNNELK